jgi:hypothetical protein
MTPSRRTLALLAIGTLILRQARKIVPPEDKDR